MTVPVMVWLCRACDRYGPLGPDCKCVTGCGPIERAASAPSSSPGARPEEATPTWPVWLEETATLKETEKAGASNSYVGGADLDSYTGVADPEQDDTEARMRALGIAGVPGEDFPCILHSDEEHHLAWVRRARAGYFEYGCATLGARLGLSEVLASQAHGEIRRPEKALAHAWRARLDYSSGLREPLDFDLELPGGLPKYAVRFMRGVQLYVGLLFSPRWPSEFLFTRDFAQGWCALTDQQARMGQAAAERHGVLIRVGWKPLPKGRAIVWRPGPALIAGGGVS